jgi:hypothetical protein
LSLRNKTAQSQASTFSTFAEAEANQHKGRYSAELAQTVIGSDPIPKYPALPSGPWSGEDLVGQEPPLGYSVDGSRPEQSSVFPAPALPNPTAPSDPLDVERLGLGSSSPQRFAEQPTGLSQHRLDSAMLGAGGDKFHRRI